MSQFRGKPFSTSVNTLSIHSGFKNLSTYCVFCLHNWSEMQDRGRLFDKYWLSTPDNQISPCSCVRVICSSVSCLTCPRPATATPRTGSQGLSLEDLLIGIDVSLSLVRLKWKFTNSQMTAWMCRSLWRLHQRGLRHSGPVIRTLEVWSSTRSLSLWHLIGHIFEYWALIGWPVLPRPPGWARHLWPPATATCPGTEARWGQCTVLCLRLLQTF